MEGPIAEGRVSKRDQWTTDNELVEKYVKFTISIGNVTGDCPAQVRAYCADEFGDDHYALCAHIDARTRLGRSITDQLHRNEALKHVSRDLWYERTAAQLQGVAVYEDIDECKKACDIGLGYQSAKHRTA